MAKPSSHVKSPSIFSYPTIAELLLAEHERYLAGNSGNVDYSALKNFMEDRYHSFLAAVRLEEEDGASLLIDTGAVHALSGDEWFGEHINAVKRAGLGHLIKEKPTSVVVSGVGKDSEQCKTIQSVPGVLEDGSMMTFEAPKIPKSTVPALLGMQTLDEQNMGVLPWSNQLVKIPKGKEHEIQWPQGTTFINCKRARTGHMMLPIGNFKKLKNDKQEALVAFTANSILEQQRKLAAMQLGLNPSAQGSLPQGTVNWQ